MAYDDTSDSVSSKFLWVVEERLDNFPQLVVRKGFKYGGGLQPGRVEVIADSMFYSMSIKTGKDTFRAEALHPDQQVLFCFEGSLFLKGDR